MRGMMMETPLLITSIMRHAEQLHGDREIVSVTGDNPRHRYDYASAFRRARQLANALRRLDVAQGDRLGTLAWSDHRHFEVYYAVACYGAVCHTINPRLFEAQLEYIIDHAADRYLFVDPDYLPLIEKLAPRLTGLRGVIVLTTRACIPQSASAGSLGAKLLCYEELLAAESDQFDWPALDEQTASSLCYTSGTTGLPKGVLYSHRSNVLHTLCSSSPDVLGLRNTDTVMPIVPMFHANAWGIPYSAAMAGAKLVLPGAKLGDAATLAELIETEGIDVAFGVPTVWTTLLQFLQIQNRRLTKLRRVYVGGSACSLALLQQLRDRHGVTAHHAWGMTETSPVGTVNSLTATRANLATADQEAEQLLQGRAVFGVELKIVDDANRAQPWDGIATGMLKVRGPFVCADYFQPPEQDSGSSQGKSPGSSSHDSDGWFSTGDMAAITPNGHLRIADRIKDVIKSGGEWISSIDLENAAMSFPGIAEAAVIAVAHPKWQERPLLLVVAQAGRVIDKAALLAMLSTKVAKWWIPDDVVVVSELPHTASGKIDKLQLRKKFADHQLV